MSYFNRCLEDIKFENGLLEIEVKKLKELINEKKKEMNKIKSKIVQNNFLKIFIKKRK